MSLVKYFFLGEIPCQSDSFIFFVKMSLMPLIFIFCHSVTLSVMLFFFKVVFAAPDLNMLSLVCSFCNLVFLKLSLMPPIPVLLIIGIVLILFSLMVCQEGGRLLKESEFYFSFSFFFTPSFLLRLASAE